MPQAAVDVLPSRLRRVTSARPLAQRARDAREDDEDWEGGLSAEDFGYPSLLAPAPEAAGASGPAAVRQIAGARFGGEDGGGGGLSAADDLTEEEQRVWLGP